MSCVEKMSCALCGLLLGLLNEVHDFLSKGWMQARFKLINNQDTSIAKGLQHRQRHFKQLLRSL